MRRTLLALALAGAALTTTSAHAAPLFERRCTGKLDTRCHYQFCGFASCTTSDCVVFHDPFEGHNTGTCLGPARPEPGPGGS